MAPTVVKTEVEIAASPEHVWRELTDFASYPAWNPLMVKASGLLAPGERLKVLVVLGKRLRTPLKPRVTVVRENQELRWVVNLVVPGIFDVERLFEVTPDPERGGVRFAQSERCAGVLRPLLMAGDLEARIYRGHDAMNAALRERVEAGTGSPDG